MFKPKQKTIKQILVESVVRSFIMVACFGSAFILTGGMATKMAYPEAPSIPAIQPASPNSPEALVKKHDCWTREAPSDMRGVIPGHVVVTKGDTTVYGGSKLVGQALEQIFEGKAHNLTVHGFCR